MSGEQYTAWISGRSIGAGRDASPSIEGGMFGYTARARSRQRRRWLTSRPYPDAAEALADLWALCLADMAELYLARLAENMSQRSARPPSACTRRQLYLVRRDCPLFDGSIKQATLGDVLRS